MPAMSPVRSQPPAWAQPHRLVNVIVDTPMGSRHKFKLDQKSGLFKLTHTLAIGSTFPYDFGFIPGTSAEDGDAIDVIIIGEAPTFVGCLVEVSLIGVIEAEQIKSGKTARNDRLLGVAAAALDKGTVHHINDLGSEQLRQLEVFFEHDYKIRGHHFCVLHRRGPDAARELVMRAMDLYHQSE
jgi:inorganic pyrophosphatase